MSNKAELLNGKEKAENLLTQVIANKPVFKKVAKSVESYIKQLNEQIIQFDKTQEKANWQNLFYLLSLIAEADETDDSKSIVTNEKFGQLSTFWQKRIQEQLTLPINTNNDDRLDKTLEIEILAKVESPKELSDKRMAVQVRLMQEQMLSGGNVDLSANFVQWLQLGQLNTQDLPLLERVKAVFN